MHTYRILLEFYKNNLIYLNTLKSGVREINDVQQSRCNFFIVLKIIKYIREVFGMSHKIIVYKTILGPIRLNLQFIS